MSRHRSGQGNEGYATNKSIYTVNALLSQVDFRYSSANEVPTQVPTVGSTYL